MIHIQPCDPTQPEAEVLLAALSETLDRITGSSGKQSFNPEDMQSSGSLFVIARDANGVAVGCGAYRPLQPGIAELKRMFARPGTKGVGAALLAFLEDRARADGYQRIWLETRKVNQHAVRFYTRAGYAVMSNFGSYVGRSEAVCFEKVLSALP